MISRKAFSHRHTTDMSRHWCPRSQRFTGGDALLTYLDNGWEVYNEVTYEEYWQGGARRMFIYEFVLIKGGQHVRMRVIDNPFVERLMRDLQIRALPTAHARSKIRQSSRIVKQVH